MKRKPANRLDRSFAVEVPLFTSIVSIAASGILAACGGGSDGPAPTMIQGTVAVGAPVPGATVTVMDADAATGDVTGTAGADGAFSLDVSTLKAPLLVSAAGSLNGEPVIVVAVVPSLTSNDDNTTNVTSLTNAVAALIAPGGDLNALASATAIAGISASTVANASALVVNTLSSDPQFASLLGASFDPLTTPFAANGSGIDAVLDQLAVEVTSSGVSLTNLSAPVTDATGAPEPVTLTAEQVSDPASAPALPTSTPSSELPTSAEMAALAKKLGDCLALPLSQRVTLDADKNVLSVSTGCNFAPATWKSDGGSWAERAAMGLMRYDAFTGAKVGTPTIAAVFPAPNYSGTTFQHPYCNTQTCVAMSVPLTTASGRPAISQFLLGRVEGQWDYVGNQLPYSLGVEHRLQRKVAVNTVLAASDPTNYFRQDRMEALIRMIFNPIDSGAAQTDKIRSVVWKGPGLPAAGVVTHRSQRCGSGDRFAISNQEGLQTLPNSSGMMFWQPGAAADFIVDAARLDGSAMTMPAPTTNWATNPNQSNQDFRSSPFTGAVAAWSTYTAEIFYFSNTGSTPDEVIMVRNGTPFERAAQGATKNWPSLSQSFIDQYLKPSGASAGPVTSLDQTISWTNPSDGHVVFAYLFAQNRISATNSEGETANYWKRGNLFFRATAYGDTSAVGYEWTEGRAGTATSSFTASSSTNPNPRCTSDDLVPLDGDNTNASYREAGLQHRGPDRKLYQMVHFWTN